MTSYLPHLLGRVHPALAELSGVPLAIFLVVIALTTLFLLWYLLQGVRIWWQLTRAISRVEKFKAEKRPTEPSDIAIVFRTATLRHLWEEYEDTLHPVRRASSGNTSLMEWRATVPAEMFFTREVLVDSRLFDDFTRHLPGILTGLGIIGTFAGLLQGLGQFDATSSATAVSGLKPLLEGVSHAFTASAVAIACAMGVTFLSRLVLALFYRKVERLNHAIDALYATGAGEEYLSRLVHASEKSEAHAAQLKQALVEDLTKLMTNLTERQIQAQSEVTRALGAQLGETLTQSLAGPLNTITEAMRNSTKANSEAVTGMLENLLTGFMAKLEDTFGGQMRGIHEQMDRSMNAMTTVQQSLQKLVDDINRSGEAATTRLRGTLEDAMKQAASNQQLLTEQMRQFVDEFRKLAANEQAKSMRTMDDAIAKVMQTVEAAVQGLEAVRKSAADHEQSRNDNLANRTRELVSGLGTGVDTLLEAIGAQVTLTQQNIDAIGAVTSRAIDGMNAGALTMGTAAERFQTAGSAVSGVFARSAEVAERLSTTATALQTAATAVRQGFEQYDNTRRTVDANVQALTILIENAKKEAGLSRQMLNDLERIVAQLRAAETQSEQYLEGVNKTLARAFEDFGTQLVEQIRKAIGETDRHLAGGVQHLNGVVQQIGVAVSRLKGA